MPIVSTITTGNVIKNEAGTLTLSGANSYGNTTVNGGTLLVDNTSGSGTGQGNVTVNNGATLGGTGSISGSVTMNNLTSGTTLSPGDPIGTPADLATGSLTLKSGDTFAVQLNGTAAGTGYDQVMVTGSVNLGGATLTATRASGFVPPNGTPFVLISNDDVRSAIR